MAAATDATRFSIWERRTQWPLVALSVIFLSAYAWPILQPQIPRYWHDFCDGILWATWGAFAADYAVRFTLAPDKRAFVRSDVIGLLSVLLPIFRPLRLLRLISLLTVINRFTESSLRGRVAAYVSVSTCLLLFVASLAVLEAERPAAGANIHSEGDAIWWAATTMATVGYGDRYPVTTEGRVVAGALMVAGIGLLGVVTAGLASWFVDKVKASDEAAAAMTRHDILELSAEVRRLRAELHAFHGSTIPEDDESPAGPVKPTATPVKP